MPFPTSNRRRLRRRYRRGVAVFLGLWLLTLVVTGSLADAGPWSLIALLPLAIWRIHLGRMGDQLTGEDGRRALYTWRR